MITTVKMGAFVLVFLSFAAVCGAAVSEPNVIYVDDNSPGPTRDGQSWATAYRYLQDALQNAASGDYICVAQGVYKPDRDSSQLGGTGNRADTFQLKNGVKIYGGYGGYWSADPNGRDFKKQKSILRI